MERPKRPLEIDDEVVDITSPSIKDIWSEIVIDVDNPLPKEDEVCCLCGFNISAWERDHSDLHSRGRRWAGSFQFLDKWICGSCGDDLRQRE